MRMYALVLHGVGDARYESVPIPRPGPGMARVRVASCGVCGSDLPRMFVKGTYRFPTICGHEFAGTVDAVGEGVSEYSPGDRVTAFPLIWCDRCPACESGEYAQCSSYDYLGSRSDGAFAEYVVAPSRNLLRVPDGISLEAASMTEPAAVALHAIRRVPEPLVGETVAVFGAGPIGLLVSQWARICGAGTVVIFDLVPRKLETARDLGFRYTFDAGARNPVEEIRALTGDHGAGVCMEAAGAPVALRRCIEAARPGGHVVILGNPGADVMLPASLVSLAMRSELSLHGSWNSRFSATGRNDDWHAVLSAAARGRLALEPLISHRVPLAEAFDVLKMMRDQAGLFSKVLIQP